MQIVGYVLRKILQKRSVSANRLVAREIANKQLPSCRTGAISGESTISWGILNGLHQLVDPPACNTRRFA